MTLPDPLWRPPPRPGPPRDCEITPRMAVVLSGLCLGLTNRQIAARLFVVEDTVKTHVKAILRALGAANRCEAAALAVGGHARITVSEGRALRGRSCSPQRASHIDGIRAGGVREWETDHKGRPPGSSVVSATSPGGLATPMKAE